MMAKVKQEKPNTANRKSIKQKVNIDVLQKDDSKIIYNKTTKETITSKERLESINEEWFDKDCIKVVEERKRTRMKMLEDTNEDIQTNT